MLDLLFGPCCAELCLWHYKRLFSSALCSPPVTVSHDMWATTYEIGLWSNMQLIQVWCENLNPPVRIRTLRIDFSLRDISCPVLNWCPTLLIFTFIDVEIQGERVDVIIRIVKMGFFFGKAISYTDYCSKNITHTLLFFLCLEEALSFWIKTVQSLSISDGETDKPLTNL